MLIRGYFINKNDATNPKQLGDVMKTGERNPMLSHLNLWHISALAWCVFRLHNLGFISFTEESLNVMKFAFDSLQFVQLNKRHFCQTSRVEVGLYSR